MRNNCNHDDSQKGFAFIAIILVVVVIFSITLVSGAQEFQYSVETPPPPKATTPTPGAGGTNPTPTPVTNPPGSETQGTISVTLQGCRTTKEPRMEAVASISSTSAGNILLEVQEGSSFRQIISLPFTGGAVSQNLLLHNSFGFNTNNWQIRLVNNNTTLVTYNGSPTGC